MTLRAEDRRQKIWGAAAARIVWTDAVKTLRLGFFLSVTCFCVFSPVLSKEDFPQIWFAPLDNLYRSYNKTKGPDDYPELFNNPGQWDQAARHVDVFKIYPDWAERAEDASLRSMLQWLTDRHISLGLEYGGLRASATCGTGIEGYDGGNLKNVLLRMKRLGGRVDYIALDEPLWYGHIYRGPRSCNASIPDLAQELAVQVKMAETIFPDIRIGDIEPFPQQGTTDWIDDINSWPASYRAATGRKLDFLHVDVMWGQNWLEPTRALHSALKLKQIPFGVIYNGSSTDRSNKAWLDSVMAHYAEFEGAGERPENVVFQSWSNAPDKLLPDTASDAMTSLILSYTTYVSSIKK